MTVVANLRNGSLAYTFPLMQYDKGQTVRLSGVTVPATYYAEFSNSPCGITERYAQTSEVITVPDKYLTSGRPVYGWIVMNDMSSRTTAYTIMIPVTTRAKPDEVIAVFGEAIFGNSLFC